jgi:hypothetical protein
MKLPKKVPVYACKIYSSSKGAFANESIFVDLMLLRHFWNGIGLASNAAYKTRCARETCAASTLNNHLKIPAEEFIYERVQT